MNTCLTFTCEICEEDTDCRIGYSNREIQPLSFACPHCSSLMEITLNIKRAPASDFQFEGCKPSKNQPTSYFEGINPFVDLHLDFPVRFTKYVKGLTPFMAASGEIAKHSNEKDPNIFLKKMSFHKERLNQLNYFYDKSSEIKKIIKLYNGENKKLFKKRVEIFLDRDQGISLKPQDINASLYDFISTVFFPFISFEEIEGFIDQLNIIIPGLPSEPMNNFMEKIITTDYLHILQKDCLKLYPEIYNAEMPLRPALYLDLIPDYEKAKMAARVSTEEFQSYKDLYKDIVEVFSRQLILVAGINNLIHRGNCDSFLVISGGALSSLDKFATKSLAEKFKYLDNCWYPLDKEIIDTNIRNAIAHNNIEYNDLTQEITYYPKGGKIEPADKYIIYFLDFMRIILVTFREMHNLHHLIKCLFYYEFLIRNKDN